MGANDAAADIHWIGVLVGIGEPVASPGPPDNAVPA
jgi:hypothetical protein